MTEIVITQIGHTAVSGGASEYYSWQEDFINSNPEIANASHFYGDRGTKKDKKTPIFIPTANFKNRGLPFIFGHAFNLCAYNLLIWKTALRSWLTGREIVFWTHSADFLKYRLFWFFGQYLVRCRMTLMLDVRDQLSIPNKNMFNKTNARICFIACSKKIYKLLTNDFNFQIIYSPPECNDVSLSSLYAIKTSNYFVYGHGLDSKRDETKLLKVAKHLQTTGHRLFIIGRSRSASKVCKQLLALENVEYLGEMSNHALFCILASSSGLIIVAGKDGVPRVGIEAIALGVNIFSFEQIDEFNSYPQYRQVVLENEIAVPSTSPPVAWGSYINEAKKLSKTELTTHLHGLLKGES